MVVLGDVRLGNNFAFALFTLELLFQFTRVYISRTHHGSKYDYKLAYLVATDISDISAQHVLNGRDIYKPYIHVLFYSSLLFRVRHLVLHLDHYLLLAYNQHMLDDLNELSWFIMEQLTAYRVTVNKFNNIYCNIMPLQRVIII